MGSANDDRVRVNVLFDGKDASTVAQSLRDAGLRIEQELDLLGVISGEIGTEDIEKLRHIDGVLTVEEDRQVDVGDQ